MNVKHLAVLAGALAASAAPAAVMTETVVGTSDTIEIDFGGTYDVDLFLDKFDTQGGTRELVGIDFEYTTDYTATITWGANPFPDQPAGTDIGVEVAWHGTLDGGIPISYNLNSHGNHELWSRSYWGINLDPGEGAGSADDAHASVVLGDAGMNPTNDAALFAALTGAGQAHIDGAVDIGEMIERQLLGPLHDIFVPDHVFVPGLISGEMDTFFVQIAVDYHYVTVPAPGAASALALGCAAIGVRRRRRA